MTSKAELACVYAALILVDDDVAVTVSVFMYNFLRVGGRFNYCFLLFLILQSIQ